MNQAQVDAHKNGDCWYPTCAICEAEDRRCAVCGDDAEPANCPDRHGWDDHGLCCVGSCAACQTEMTDDYQGEPA